MRIYHTKKMLALKIYKISHFFFKKKIKIISKILDIINYYLHNSFIPGSCKIGEGTKIAYGGIGIVIHSRAVIGKNCMIGQGITIGGRNGEKEVPIIGDNIYIGAGSRILGNIKIENNVIIAPNSVIIKDIKILSVIAGNPGKIINYITKENYYKYKDYYNFIKLDKDNLFL